MNILWTSIVIICFIFSIFTNNFTNLINSLFDVPEQSLILLCSIGGTIILYNGIFQIAIDSKLIKSISFLFKPILKRIYKINNDDVLELLCANFTANLLGIGAASTPIAINVISKLNKEDNIIKLILLNVSCFTIFPFSIITIREKLNGTNNFKIFICIIIVSFLSTIFSIFISKIGEKK